MESLAAGDSIFDWQPDMIPFLEDGGGNNICVRTLSDDKSVWAIYHDDDPKILNSSLESFVLTVIEFYRRGVYFQGNDGCLEMDENLSEEIVREIDPEIINIHLYRPQR